MNIIESIYKTPEDWRQTRYTFNHRSGVELWTSNGFWFFQPYTGGSFGFIEKWKTWRAYRWWLKNVPVEHMHKFCEVSK